MDGVSTDLYQSLGIFTLSIKLAYLLIAISASLALLRIYDKRAKISFSEWLNNAIENQFFTAVALYFGMRFFAVCWLISTIFS
ncbi:hypothetical protein H0A36_25795 [Endozoicomonas sp. SM1973]|uniref:Uncharacterized protein n=1 Tax=Spartinivicinus marinus TaxID=2994442 RepID=A0A853I7Z4_9GAMM|nr:hypothetical protein [Spartinivicinus marinus]MCX4030279.1 hypothetical protein [Spartinivicinus marinus]MCX4030418.1 hypothetical protein [Spartinivicinus marinus]NYZ69433.1 hypothetical protein [Spartinivicinus marinus]